MRWSSQAAGGALDTSSQGVLAPSLANVGATIDNVAPLGLSSALGDVGAAADALTAPVTSGAVSLTQAVGQQTQLGAPTAGLLESAGAAVAGLGAGTGLEATLAGVGGGVASLGGTGRPELGQRGQPAGRDAHPGNRRRAGSDGRRGRHGCPASGILQPGLTNAGGAVDNVVPLGAGAHAGQGGARRPTTSPPRPSSPSPTSRKARARRPV